MIYRKIGEELVSAVGFGTGFHSPKEGDYDLLEKTIRSAMATGVNFIDTAPVYGDGISEIMLGKIFKEINRSNVFLASKVSPEDTTFSGVIKSVESSLRRLNTDWLDLCQIHWPSTKVSIEETMSAMEKLVEDGKIRNIGVSNFSLNEAKGALSSLNNNSLASIQSEYNFFERSVEGDVLPFCKQNNVKLIAYSPLAQGNLANGDEQKGFLGRLAEKYNSTPGQIVLRWLISNPNVIVIPNTSKPHRAIENGLSADIHILEEDYEKMSTDIKTPVSLIDTKEIKVTNDYGRKVYQTLQEALDNNMNMSPTPIELSEQMKSGVFLKPIRLKELKDDTSVKKYDLVEGRLRYWSWIIAHGWEKPIPALVWKNK